MANQALLHYLFSPNSQRQMARDIPQPSFISFILTRILHTVSVARSSFIIENAAILASARAGERPKCTRKLLFCKELNAPFKPLIMENCFCCCYRYNKRCVYFSKSSALPTLSLWLKNGVLRNQLYSYSWKYFTNTFSRCIHNKNMQSKRFP